MTPGRRAAPRRPGRPRACTTCSGPSRPAGRERSPASPRLVESAGYGLAVTPILEHAGVFLRGHRRGERGGRQGDVRLRGPRRPDDGAASRGDRAHRPRLRAAPPRAALEGLVRGAVVPPREPPARPLPPAPPARRGGARARADADLDVEVVSLAHDFFAGLGLRDVTLKLHSMGDGVCKPGYVALLGAFLADAGRSVVPGAPGPPPREPAAGARLQDARVPGGHRGRAPLPRPPLRPLRGPLRPRARRAGGARRRLHDRPPPRPGLRLLHAHHLRVRRRRTGRGAERHRRRRSLRRAGRAAGRRRPRRASGSGSGSSGSCSPATPRAYSAPTPWWRPGRCTPT